MLKWWGIAKEPMDLCKYFRLRKTSCLTQQNHVEWRYVTILIQTIVLSSSLCWNIFYLWLNRHGRIRCWGRGSLMVVWFKRTEQNGGEILWRLWEMERGTWCQMSANYFHTSLNTDRQHVTFLWTATKRELDRNSEAFGGLKKLKLVDNSHGKFNHWPYQNKCVHFLFGVQQWDFMYICNRVGLETLLPNLTCLHPHYRIASFSVVKLAKRLSSGRVICLWRRGPRSRTGKDLWARKLQYKQA